MGKLYYNVDFFTKKSENYYYFLGVALTDGNISYQSQGRKDLVFTLDSKDTEWLERIYSLTGGSIKYRYPQKCDSLRFFNEKINNIILKDGCIPRKTAIVRLPTVPKKFFLDFLRGCIDGDGSISYNSAFHKKANKSYMQSCIYLCSASKRFLNDIDYILKNRFGIITSFFIAANKGDTSATFPYKRPLYRIQLSGKNAYHLIQLLGYDSDKFAMQRKRETALKIINHYASSRTVSARGR